jgi:hypothetical protein
VGRDKRHMDTVGVHHCDDSPRTTTTTIIIIIVIIIITTITIMCDGSRVTPTDLRIAPEDHDCHGKQSRVGEDPLQMPPDVGKDHQTRVLIGFERQPVLLLIPRPRADELARLVRRSDTITPHPSGLLQTQTRRYFGTLMTQFAYNPLCWNYGSQRYTPGQSTAASSRTRASCPTAAHCTLRTIQTRDWPFGLCAMAGPALPFRVDKAMSHPRPLTVGHLASWIQPVRLLGVMLEG